MLKSWRFWLGIVISIFFIMLAVRGQDLGQVRRALADADYRYLPVALALYFAGVGARALRWRHLLAPVCALRARTLFPIVVIGYMANNILPWRLGEFVRAYALRERAGVRNSASLATIAVERVFDGLTMLGFLLVASLFIPINDQLRRLAFLATAIFGILLVALVIGVRSEKTRAWTLALVGRFLPEPISARLTAIVENFVHGLQVLRTKGDLAAVAGLSLLIWGLEASMYLAIAPAFRLPLGPAGALMTTAVANLATLIPSTPGYIGVFETGVVLVLNGLLGVNRELALSYAIVVHAALYFPITLWGLYYWLHAHLSLRAVRAISVSEAATGPAAKFGEGSGAS